MEERKNREIDGYFFRVKRNDKYENVCFSDLTEDEMKEVLNNRPAEWLISLCVGLGQTIRQIGDTFDIIGGYVEEEKKESCTEKEE